MYSFFFRKLQKVTLLLLIYWAVIGREGSSEKSYENKTHNTGFISPALL